MGSLLCRYSSNQKLLRLLEDDEPPITVISTTQRRQYNCLLLGTGCVGKSTFFKQLLFLHHEISDKVAIDATKSVYDSLMQQMKFMIQDVDNSCLKLNSDEAQEAREFIENIPR